MKTTPIAVTTFIDAVKAQTLPVIFNLAIVLKPYAADHHGRGPVLGAEYHVEDGYFRDTSANIKIYANAVDSVVVLDSSNAECFDSPVASAPALVPVECVRRHLELAGIDPFEPTRGAIMPMIADSWRFGFTKVGDVLMFSHLDDGPFVAWDAVKDRVAAADVATAHAAELAADLNAHDAPVQLVDPVPAASVEPVEEQSQQEEQPKEEPPVVQAAVQQQPKAGHSIPKANRDFVQQRKNRR